VTPTPTSHDTTPHAMIDTAPLIDHCKQIEMTCLIEEAIERETNIETKNCRLKLTETAVAD